MAALGWLLNLGFAGSPFTVEFTPSEKRKVKAPKQAKVVKAPKQAKVVKARLS